MGGPTAPAEPDAVTSLLLDEMYPPSLAKELRMAGHDVLAVLDVQVGLAARSDQDVLAWADRNDRCVVTENIADYARMAALGVPHAGIVFVSSQRFPCMTKGLKRLADVLQDLLDVKGLPPRGGVIWLSSGSG